MYDAKWIIGGLIIFVILVAYPVWYGVASGEATQVPDLADPIDAEKCVETTEYMRANHKQLLLTWRDSVVRDGVRTYVATDATEYEMSLTGTCMGCHQSKTSFCDRCHDYVGQEPDCWDCHLPPEENQ